jgi:hypothetical protein
MPRTIDSTTLTALEGSTFRMCHLLEINLSSIIRLTDNSYPVNYAGQTYSPSGHLLTIGATSESSELRVGGFNLGLSGVSQEYVSILLTDDYVAKDVSLFLALLDNSGIVIGDAIKTFEGQIESFAIQDNDNSSTINLSLSSHWADFERKTGRLTNTTSQQFYFPNDTGMRFAAESIRDIKWGKA